MKFYLFFLIVFLMSPLVAHTENNQKALEDILNESYVTSLDLLKKIPFKKVILKELANENKLSMEAKRLISKMSFEVEVKHEGNEHFVKFYINKVNVVNIVVNPVTSYVTNLKLKKSYNLYSKSYIKDFSNEALSSLKQVNFFTEESTEPRSVLLQSLSLFPQAHAMVPHPFTFLIEVIAKPILAPIDFLIVAPISNFYYGAKNYSLVMDSDIKLDGNFCCKMTDNLLSSSNAGTTNSCTDQVANLVTKVQTITSNEKYDVDLRSKRYKGIFTQKLEYLRAQIGRLELTDLVIIDGYDLEEYFADIMQSVPKKSVETLRGVMNNCSRDSFTLKYGHGPDDGLRFSLLNWDFGNLSWIPEMKRENKEILYGKERPQKEIINSRKCQDYYMSKRSQLFSFFVKASKDVTCLEKVNKIVTQFQKDVNKAKVSNNHQSVSITNSSVNSKTSEFLENIQMAVGQKVTPK